MRFLIAARDGKDWSSRLILGTSIVHIDFGWMLAKVMPMNIEASAPFKLTADMAAVLRCGSNGLGYEVILLLLSSASPCTFCFIPFNG